MIEYIKEDIEEVVAITGLTYEKAEKLFNEVAKDIDDGTDPETCSYDVIEVIKTEHKAKENGVDRHYNTADASKKERKPKERKIDNDKAFLLNLIKNGLTAEINTADITTENELKLHFSYGGNEYSVTLTKHRVKKG